jgi:hypothetical protein
LAQANVEPFEPTVDFSPIADCSLCRQRHFEVCTYHEHFLVEDIARARGRIAVFFGYDAMPISRRSQLYDAFVASRTSFQDDTSGFTRIRKKKIDSARETQQEDFDVNVILC